MNFKLGYHKDPHDPRDRQASSLLGAAPVPASANNDDLIASILDQGSYSSCVANAVMQAIRASHIYQGFKDAPLGSRLFGYYMARAANGQQNQDEGTYIRSLFSTLNSIGFCPEDTWPYSEPVNHQPNFKALRAAIDQKSPTTYLRIYETGSARVDVVKRALAARHLVVFGTQLAATYFDAKGDAPVMPPVGQPWIGGHAQVLKGFVGDDFDNVNSWGTSWGNNGCIKLAADYIAWAETNDLWIVSSAPRFSTP